MMWWGIVLRQKGGQGGGKRQRKSINQDIKWAETKAFVAQNFLIGLVSPTSYSGEGKERDPGSEVVVSYSKRRRETLVSKVVDDFAFTQTFFFEV